MAEGEIVQLQDGDALVIVDMQKDFHMGGALAVNGSDAVLAVVNRLIAKFRARGLPRFYSQCSHPADHISFSSRGGEHPEHCIAGTPGAEFIDGLDVDGAAACVLKGTCSEQDAYSAFRGTPMLAKLLRDHGVKRLFVCGLALDFCVGETCKDSVAEGFDTILVVDATAGVFPDKTREMQSLLFGNLYHTQARTEGWIRP